ncbi:MAG: BON domain-containing protein [Bradyrhizobium sp.]|nr:BON domain-containing protein [Pseudomonadota bacterium]MDE2066536.1 BON domain-containing protein [Bradyrhizobium sp.]MDE2472799.1 BON domain-containing protein [Bradyrhizobium sp.]
MLGIEHPQTGVELQAIDDRKGAAQPDVFGSVGVTNKIALRGRVSAADVKAKIEAALKRQAEIEAGAIRVSVTGGDHVVLEGKVDNWSERRAAEDAAWSAVGVMSVDDLITIC